MNKLKPTGGAARTHTVGRAVTRRTAVAACCALCASAAASFLAGCDSAGTQSAKKIAITPAFDEGFLVVHEGMTGHRDDARLVGISTRRTVEEGSASKWAYRYVSRKHVREYSAWLRSGEFYYETRQQGASYLQSEMEAVPSWEEILVDADEAYALIAEQLDDKHVVLAVDVYLRTFISVTEKADDAGVKTMTWYFAFNQQEKYDEYGEPLDAGSAPFVYAVDAITGKVELVADET